ncbi:MAG TPA: cytochrome c oxidase assembly factor Coa1 family protein [Terriglobales bacterium]|nr:cytochrome c oxidase assembly factor Coa1 family protein [Terriglobales bacterium]
MSAQAAFPVPQPNWWSRNWKWFVPAGCLTLILLFCLFLGLIITIVMGSIKSSDAYKQAVAKARANPTVVEKLGTPIAEGYFVSGNINVENDSGNADLQIPISGPKGKAVIHAVASKSAGKWEYSRLTVTIEGQPELDLLEPAPGPEQ